MADTVPIYVQERGNNYRYGTQTTTEKGWGSATVAFYAYTAQQEGTMAFYRHRAGTTDRYQYDNTSPAHDGWNAGEDPIYLYPPDQPRTGAIPIYVHTAGGGNRIFYDTKIPNTSGWTAGQLAFYALPSLDGYGVGDNAAEISGEDQSNKTVKLSTYNPGKGWVLIDICAQWCGPCNFAAGKTRAFIDSVNSQKLPLKLLTVLVDNRDYKASTQLTANQWATRYNFNANEAVIHCAGDEKSDLRWLVYKYALANANPQPAFPTYVIVDSDGVIRHFQQGFDLDNVQRVLASVSGVTLTGGPWIA